MFFLPLAFIIFLLLAYLGFPSDIFSSRFEYIVHFFFSLVLKAINFPLAITLAVLHKF